MDRRRFAALLILSLFVVLHEATAEVHQVNVTATDAFVPGLLYVTTGDTVVWANQPGSGSSPHNVVSDDGLFRCAAGCNSSADATVLVVGQRGNGTTSSAAWSFNITFLASGLYPYYCDGLGGEALSGMSGAIFVIDPPVQIDKSYNGVISGGHFVAIIVGVVGGAILGVILLVISIAAFRNRHSFINFFLRLKAH